MPQYSEDFLYSDSGAAPPASPLLQPPGIGLESQAPVQPMSPRDQLQKELGLSGIQKFGLALQDFGAGTKGREPVSVRMLRAREEAATKNRQRSLEEIKAFSDITNKTFEGMDKLDGEDRKSYIALQMKVLNALSPGSGELLKSLADDPEYGKLVMKNAEKSPTLKTALEVGGLRKARELMKSTEGAKLVRSEIEGAELPAIRTKLQTLGLAAKELMAPDRHKKMLEDGFISPNEVAELNEAALAHPKYKAAALTPEQMSLAARNEDATYGMAGFATSKTAQERLKAGPQSTVGKIRADLAAGRITQKEADDAIKKANEPGGVNIFTGPTAGVDAQGNPVFFQTPKKGGKPEIVPGVRPKPTGNPILDAVADVIRNPEGKPQAAKAAKYKVGDTLTRGGKKWKVTGFDKDGEPLVEEVKSSASGKVKR